MTDDTAGTLTAAENTAQAAPAPAQVEDEAPPEEVAQEGAEGEEGDDQPTEPDEVEIDHDGVKAKVPKALKDAFLRHQDYTRKTQALAQERQQAAAEIARAQQALWGSFNEASSVARLDAEIAKFKDIDWVTWAQTDPGAAQRARLQYDALKDQRDQSAARLRQAVQQQQQAEQQDLAERLRTTVEYARTTIPGWNAEVDAAVHNFVREQGVSDEQILSVMSPAAYRIMYLAMIGDQDTRKAGQKTVTRPAAESEQPAPIQPLKSVSSRGSSGSTQSRDKMSVDAWLKKRNEELARKRA